MQNQDRFKTILVIVVGLSVLSLIFKNYYHKTETAVILSQVALGIGLASLIAPIAAKWIELGWLKLAQGLGWVNSRILLSIVYFVFLLPIAWLSRLFTKDPLMLKKRNQASLYVTRDHQYKKEDLENIW